MPEKVKDALDCMMDELSGKTELANGGAIYSISRVKWYESYEDVKAIEDFLESLDAEKGEYYELLRIGEDDDDSEHRGNGEHQMWIDRSINTDYCNMDYGDEE